MKELVNDIGDAIRYIDRSGIPFKNFRPGAGPYGEPQLVKLIAKHLSERPDRRYSGARTCRKPDVLIPGQWALEFKIVRPFGDNGIEAEHWSQNLLHPYPGNVSAISDAIKLLQLPSPEQKGVIVICYEHQEPRIDLSLLVAAFELIARDLMHLPLQTRFSCVVPNCCHPVHQKATVHGWKLGA